MTVIFVIEDPSNPGENFSVSVQTDMWAPSTGETVNIAHKGRTIEFTATDDPTTTFIANCDGNGCTQTVEGSTSDSDAFDAFKASFGS
jgi:hypothetical protein